ncbi:GNAT family N-acetyltransferase [Aquimarina sp. MMG016]|uniref:GNAT family N-acetyltransferase n=1 Tax=Aquimarina sp. MMG016 TaxID=2822690 RepID=UPI001B3A524D|nr:GNAT family N-acetyltransferase [Aquimarina sp. MMG016]MBQ4820899.1 GNAT family N-acetyltransferase [Aquimarina sp. MMG016]
MSLEISTDHKRLDIDFIHQFLTNAYWAKGRTREEVVISINNCLSFGVYYKNKQIGFARILTDYTVFAYLMDVFIVEEYRGKGYSKQLMQAIVEHPNLQNVKRWMLATKDAHGLYQQFGFKPLPDPSLIMGKLIER